MLILSTDHMEAFQPSGMFRAGGQQVDAGGLNRAVAQHVRKPDDVLADTIEGRGKQMPEIMGKYPRGLHASLSAEAFHLCPDLLSGQCSSASGKKNLAGGDFLFLRVLE